MKIAAAIIICLALVALPVHGAQYRDAAAYCAHLFPNSYTMLESCINQESEAAARVNRRRVDQRIWNYCQRLFPNSWTMIESCLDQEEAAKRRLGPIRR